MPAPRPLPHADAPLASGGTPPYLTAAFYRFVHLPDAEALRAALQAECDAHGVQGVVLLAHEGINGTIAGTPQAVRHILAWLRADPRLAALEHKEAHGSRAPFYRMRVRFKPEIVTLGVPGVDAAAQAGTYVAPHDWNALIRDPDVVVIDTRNDYEVAIGTFPGALDPKTRAFRELPQWVDAHADQLRGKKIAMFCTGGIRCEKSTALMRQRGYGEVYHLQGGILKYLETVAPQDSLWRGECFVFDERVAVGPGLAPGTHALCYGCRLPIGPAERASPLYRPGVSCPHCHGSKDAQRLQG
ncbi:MAG: rhodanese-related sulfurtransferase, partial [Comamonas sp.]